MNNRAAQKASYIDLFDRIQDPLLIIDQNYQVIDANPGAEGFFGLSIEQLKDFNISFFFDSSDDMQKEMRRTFRRYHPRIFEKTVDLNGQTKHLKIESCCLDLSESGSEEPIKVAQILIKDQTELMEAKKALEAEKKKLEEANVLLAQISITDKLTDLYNRRYYDETMAKEFERAERTSSDLALILFDVDKFKHYNDTNGHGPGDELLTELAKIIKSCVRQIDVPCRYGGEEFIVICPNTNSEQAYVVAERIRLAIMNHDFKHKEKQPLGFVSASIGVASYPLHANNPSLLKDLADKALYLSKETGRNKTTIWK
jgi:diguanylate cyclase (GGDEF)-like protein/PAS domain S-box-containing protein